MSDAKAIISSLANIFASWTTGRKKPGLKTSKTIHGDSTWRADSVERHWVQLKNSLVNRAPKSKQVKGKQWHMAYTGYIPMKILTRRFRQPVMTNGKKINNDPVCFGARDDTNGAFNVTKTGHVKAMRLVHRNGSITCHPDYPPTFWSCSNVNYYPSNTFMTIITNANREALLPSSENLKAKCSGEKEFYILDGVNQGTSELILDNLSRPLSLLKDQQLQIWYGQDWIDCSEYNNNGTSCVDIFAWYVWDWQGGFIIKFKKISDVVCLIFEIAAYIVWSPLFRVV